MNWFEKRIGYPFILFVNFVTMVLTKRVWQLKISSWGSVPLKRWSAYDFTFSLDKCLGWCTSDLILVICVAGVVFYISQVYVLLMGKLRFTTVRKYLGL